ncbi:ectonucleoside triphosphate diphosphohydrolase 7 isoform X3 [Motacilla alba alba]|uniref:ectonucleoside triphosphate diphosphohydrolase 7 isoform X3 n=1 Tax=Motacilla alba alba TaxID=1094192 RepID=UPI0018D56C7A|nr:ectonucleoside triphosphate diphosphohydrolase 7 isoform X3 [Motacilla alba alba]
MARVGVFCLSWRSVGPCPGPRQRPAVLGLALLLGLLLLLAAAVPRRWAAPPRASRRDDRYLARAEELTATDTEDSSLNYGVVVDCGSSGSRVFVYFWPPHNGNPHDLLDIKQMRDRSSRPVVKKIKPGISVTGAAPEQATPYLRPLLRFAAAHVPPRKHRETPLYILCTAGMRLLPERQQAAILEDLVTNVPLEFDFLFSKSHAEVISGKQEGVYAWIGINFVLGRFDHEDEEDAVVTVALGDQGKSLVRKRTVGILDMGGASLQIAYEVPDSGAISSPQQQDEAAKSLLAEFNLGCDVQHTGHMYRVYVNTFLGFGGNFARQRYEEHVLNQTYVHNRLHNQQTGLSPKMPFLDPCLPVGLEDTVVRGGQTLYIRGRGDWQACAKLLQPLLAGSNGSHASLVETYKAPIDFSNSEFYGFSEFFYCTEDVLRLGGQYSAPTFTSAAQVSMLQISLDVPSPSRGLPVPAGLPQPAHSPAGVRPGGAVDPGSHPLQDAISATQGSPSGEHPASARLLAAPLFRLQPLSLLCLHPGRGAGHRPLPPAAAPHPPPAALGPAPPALAGHGGGAAGPGQRALMPQVPSIQLHQQN